jgi:hypothetical protein
MKNITEIVKENCFIDCGGYSTLLQLLPNISQLLKPNWASVVDGIVNRYSMLYLYDGFFEIIDYPKDEHPDNAPIYKVKDINFNGYN